MIPTNYNPNVLTRLGNLSKDEIFTPPNLVNNVFDFQTQQEHINNLNYYASLFKDLLYAEIRCVLYYFDVEEVKQWVYAEEVKINI